MFLLLNTRAAFSFPTHSWKCFKNFIGAFHSVSPPEVVRAPDKSQFGVEFSKFYVCVPQYFLIEVPYGRYKYAGAPVPNTFSHADAMRILKRRLLRLYRSMRLYVDRWLRVHFHGVIGTSQEYWNLNSIFNPLKERLSCSATIEPKWFLDCNCKYADVINKKVECMWFSPALNMIPKRESSTFWVDSFKVKRF